MNFAFMPNPNPILNMNIKNEPKTGPKTELGKLRSSMNSLKPITLSKLSKRFIHEEKGESMMSQLMQITQKKETRKMLKYLFKDLKYDEIKRYNFFLVWLKTQTKRDIKSIVEMENLNSNLLYLRHKKSFCIIILRPYS